MLGGGAHWRHLANVIEPSLCGGDGSVISGQIVLTTLLLVFNAESKLS